MKKLSIFIQVAVSVAASFMVCGQTPALKPGVTVWVYETGQPMRELPVLVDGQTPNVSADFPALDFTGPWQSTYGADISEYYMGHAWGRIAIATGGTYEFRLSASAGAKFFLGDDAALVIDHRASGAGNNTATLNLLPGTLRYYVDFYQNQGAQRLSLEWKPPGAQDFVPVPTGTLQTEDGLTHVTSPGLKGYYYQEGEGGTAGGPGDGRPLVGVHPSYDLVNFRPSNFRPAVGGLDFLPDGRLAVSTWDNTGAVYLLGNLNGPGAVTVKQFASGLGEPLGLRVIDGMIHITQKQEVTKLVDLDGDDVADSYEAVAHGWPASFNYHEFSFNLVKKDNYLWVTTSVPLRSGSTAYLPGSEPAFPVPNGPGSLLRIDPVTRSWQAAANGLRTPNGMGIGIDGELFVSDNQGDWLPSSRLNHLQAGAFYGHRESPADVQPFVRPTLWLPHGEISNSPSEPTVIPSGTYAGQMLIAELTHGGVNRAFIEKVKGQYQGAVFQFTQGLESGMNRLVWGADGSLYVGGLGAGGNWNWKNTTSGLQRLKPNSRTTFEMKSVRARGDGLIVEFTQPVPYGVAALPANYTLQQYRYVPEETYGGPKRDVENMVISRVDVSEDRRKVFIKLPAVKADRVVALTLKNFVNDANVAPWATESWYTMNVLPDETGPDFVPLDPPEEQLQPIAPEWAVQYEAEEAVLNGPAVKNDNAGYSGAGYADYGDASGQTITWSIEAFHAGPHQVSFRYGNAGGSNRPLALRVNNVPIATIPFTSAVNWQTWVDTTVYQVNLLKGTNTITLTSTINTGPNVDYMTVVGSPPPPPGALVLFDGSLTSLRANWKRDANGAAPNWTVRDGSIEVNLSPSPNDISTTMGFKDFRLYLEWLSPSGGAGQMGGNSGVKLQRSYELQVLNTPQGHTPGMDTAGAIYLKKPADINATLGAGAWQSYDIQFTAARWSDGVKISDARISLRWNGVLVHDNVAVNGPTGASPAEAPGIHSVLLQAHATDASGPVRYRNIWVIPQGSFQQQWEDWLTSSGVSGTNPNADSDDDGMGNLWEYSSGGNPRASDRLTSEGISRVPLMSLAEEDGNRYMEFEFPRRIDADARGLRFTVETSATLAPNSWSRVEASRIGSSVPLEDGVTELIRIRINTPVTNKTQLFARVRAEILE